MWSCSSATLSLQFLWRGRLCTQVRQHFASSALLLVEESCACTMAPCFCCWSGWGGITEALQVSQSTWLEVPSSIQALGKRKQWHSLVSLMLESSCSSPTFSLCSLFFKMDFHRRWKGVGTEETDTHQLVVSRMPPATPVHRLTL